MALPRGHHQLEKYLSAPLYLLGKRDASGELGAIHWFEHDDLGKILLAFSSEEEVDRYMLMRIDADHVFLGMGERAEAGSLMKVEGFDSLIEVEGGEALEGWISLLKAQMLAIDPGSPRPVKRLHYLE